MAELSEGVSMEIADLSAVPFFNVDLPERRAYVQRLMAQAGVADALVLACPEYNYSIAPALKNAIDWISREPDNALIAGKPAAIMGAGGGMGTSRAQYHLRQVCIFLDLHMVQAGSIRQRLCRCLRCRRQPDRRQADPPGRHPDAGAGRPDPKAASLMNPDSGGSCVRLKISAM